jgi:hypothetical protein
LVAWTCGCATPGTGTRELLDAKTGATLVVVDEPLILARERRDVAVQARDYLTLVGAEINVSGRRKLFLAVHEWSTIDSRATEHVSHGNSALLLVADGRDVRLQPATDPAAASFATGTALWRPEDAFVTTTIYEIDAATLDYLATSTTLAAAYPDSFALPFALWRDGRPALRRLLSTIR